MMSSVYVFEVHLEQILDVDLRHVVDDVSVDGCQGSQLLYQQYVTLNSLYY